MSNPKFIATLAHLFGVLLATFIGFWLADVVLIGMLGVPDISAKAVIAIFIVGYLFVSMYRIYKGTDPLVKQFEDSFKK